MRSTQLVRTPTPPDSPASAPGSGSPREPDKSPGTPRRPLPVRPKDEASRLRELAGLLEWGDALLVEFAQDRLASHPDAAAVAAVLSTTIERALDRNFLLVNNALGAIGTDDLARRLEPLLRRCMEADDPVTRERALRAWARSSALR